MVKYLTGVITMLSGKQVMLVDQDEGATLSVEGVKAFLNAEELGFLAKLCNEAAYRADLRKFKDTPETPEGGQDDA